MPFETRQHPNFLRRRGSRLVLVLIAGGNCSTVLVGLLLVTDGRFVFLVAVAVGVVADDDDSGFNTGAKVFLIEFVKQNNGVIVNIKPVGI